MSISSMLAVVHYSLVIAFYRFTSTFQVVGTLQSDSYLYLWDLFLLAVDPHPYVSLLSLVPSLNKPNIIHFL